MTFQSTRSLTITGMSAGLRSAEVSRRSAFPAATLRYYEQLGLVPTPDRTPAGYRAYDESVLDRLAFIARAKALGCSLEEVADLMHHWDDGRCGPVQERLRALAAAKVVQTRSRVDELVAFIADLRRVMATLGAHTPAGPCDHDCGCLADAASPGGPLPPTPSALGKKRLSEEWPAIACSLDGEDIPVRRQDWKELLAHVSGRTPIDGGVRLELDEATPVEQLARLVHAERSCCRFFAFALTFDERGLALEVRAPSAAQPIVDELFASA